MPKRVRISFLYPNTCQQTLFVNILFLKKNIYFIFGTVSFYSEPPTCSCGPPGTDTADMKGMEIPFGTIRPMGECAMW